MKPELRRAIFGAISITIFIIWILFFIVGCTRKYDVKFSINAPETLAQEATNYQ